MTWRYSQSTGKLARDGRHIATGYSGKGAGKNNPAMQRAVALGPIPLGRWRIGKPYDSQNVGPFAIVLEPMAGTDTFGRSAFRIHGDSKSAPGTASKGCIILPRAIRWEIVQSGDTLLEVVA